MDPEKGRSRDQNYHVDGVKVSKLSLVVALDNETTQFASFLHFGLMI